MICRKLDHNLPQTLGLDGDKPTNLGVARAHTPFLRATMGGFCRSTWVTTPVVPPLSIYTGVIWRLDYSQTVQLTPNLPQFTDNFGSGQPCTAHLGVVAH